MWRVVSSGATADAVHAAIDDCVSRGVLVDYLTDRKNEVVGIMQVLYE